MTGSRVAIAAAIAAAATAGAADAATAVATFDLTGSGEYALSHSYGSGDLTADVTAYTHSNGVLGSQIYVGEWETGLGAAYHGDDTHLVDGHGPDEILLFDFGQDVTIESITVSYYDPSDDIEISVYAGTSLSGYISDISLNPLSTSDGSYDGESGDLGITSLTSAQMLTGSVIGIGSDHWSDQFKINSITVSYIAAVPLPAGAPLLAGALLGMAALRRARRRAASV